MRLRQIEAALEQALDGTFGRVLGGKLHPLEIYQALWREIEERRMVSAGATYTPNRLVARLNPADFAALEGLTAQLEAEFATNLQEEVRYNGWSYGARIQVELAADEAVHTGRVAATGRIDEDPLPARLEVDGGPLAGQVLALRPGAILGRSAECDLPLPDPAVSRHHCRFDWTFEGYKITDLGSSNGTFVNDVQVMEYVLSDNDLISVGKSRLKYQCGMMNAE